MPNWLIKIKLTEMFLGVELVNLDGCLQLRLAHDRGYVNKMWVNGFSYLN